MTTQLRAPQPADRCSVAARQRRISIRKPSKVPRNRPPPKLTSMPAEFAPSPNVAQLRPSATIAVSARAKALKAQGRQIIDLGVGEPDFDTPDFIKAAAARAVASGQTKYTATEGILPLREAIASHAAARWLGAVSDAPTAADVVVSNGSKQTLFNACFCLFGPGDEVLIPTPAWTSYVEIVALAKATPVAVVGDPAHGFQITVADLEAESIDFLDIMFRLENDFGIEISRGELFPQEMLRDSQFVAGGKLTEAGAEELRKRFAFTDLSTLQVGTDIRTQMSEMLTVKLITDYVASKLQTAVVAA